MSIFPTSDVHLYLEKTNFELQKKFIEKFEVDRYKGRLIISSYNEFKVDHDFLPCLGVFFKFAISNDCIINKKIYDLVPCISIQGNNSLNVEKYYDILLAQKESTTQPNNHRYFFPQVYNLPVDKENIPSNKVPNSNRIKIISGARGNRIFTALNNPQVVEMVCEVLADNCEWHFIGISNKQANKIIESHPRLRVLYNEGQLRFCDQVNYLRSYFSFMDLYVLLPSTGGGGMTTRLAVMEKCICLALDTAGDSLRFLSEEQIKSTVSDLTSRIVFLSRNKEERSKISIEQVENINKRTGNIELTKLKIIVDEAIENYKIRVKNND